MFSRELRMSYPLASIVGACCVDVMLDVLHACTHARSCARTHAHSRTHSRLCASACQRATAMHEASHAGTHACTRMLVCTVKHVHMRSCEMHSMYRDVRARAHMRVCMCATFVCAHVSVRARGVHVMFPHTCVRAHHVWARACISARAVRVRAHEKMSTHDVSYAARRPASCAPSCFPGVRMAVAQHRAQRLVLLMLAPSNAAARTCTHACARRIMCTHAHVCTARHNKAHSCALMCAPRSHAHVCTAQHAHAHTCVSACVVFSCAAFVRSHAHWHT